MSSLVPLDALPVAARLEDPSGLVLEANALAADAPATGWVRQVLDDGRVLAVHAGPGQGALDRARTTMFATLTHELRTPLNGILGMAGLLADARLRPAEQAWVEAIRTSGTHLLELITHILDYARLDADRIELERIAFGPADLAQSVAELLSPRAREKGLVIAACADASVPERVWGDEGRVRQILLNLAGNAVKFTREGGVVVRVSTAADGKTLCFEVDDTGPGVEPHKREAIFEVFAQADASHAREHGGSGLGLAVARRLAAVMGGAVTLDDRPGPGALFRLDLPLEQAPPSTLLPPPTLERRRIMLVTRSPSLGMALRVDLETADAHVEIAEFVPGGTVADIMVFDATLPDDERARALALGLPVVSVVPQEDRSQAEALRNEGFAQWVLAPVRARSLRERVARALGLTGAALPDAPPPDLDEREAPVSASGLRILVAEDNPVNALLARALLERAGHAVEVVADGVEALEAARQARHDLVLLDMRMPRLDGPGAARAIRALEGPARRVPIAALTADAGEDERQTCLQAGMDDFLTKPLDPRQLEALVTRLTRAMDRSA
jgi:signal transduction histidine kinase/CheY-like chemotaxis protein